MWKESIIANGRPAGIVAIIGYHTDTQYLDSVVVLNEHNRVKFWCKIEIGGGYVESARTHRDSAGRLHVALQYLPKLSSGIPDSYDFTISN